MVALRQTPRCSRHAATVALPSQLPSCQGARPSLCHAGWLAPAACGLATASMHATSNDVISSNSSINQSRLSSSNSTSCWCLAAAAASSWQWISNAAMSWVGHHHYCCCCLRLLELGSSLHGKKGLHAVRHVFGMWFAVSHCLVSIAQAQPQRKDVVGTRELSRACPTATALFPCHRPNTLHPQPHSHVELRWGSERRPPLWFNFHEPFNCFLSFLLLVLLLCPFGAW